ncbi:DDB1- and CUL4-associated factor 12-like protein 1 [Halotydeus destructor]|nr:DDB1- and CUL4-associated factor 12-like protein 1 [Halotydeus destructor]
MATVKRISVQNSRSSKRLRDDVVLRRLEKLKKMHRRLEVRNDVLTNVIRPSSSEESPSSSSQSNPAASTTERNLGTDRDKVRQVLRDMDWLEDYLKVEAIDPSHSINAVDYIHARAVGNQRIQRASYNKDYATKRIIQRGLMGEKLLTVDGTNKIFCAQWLSDRQVIIGTKCNQLKVLDVKDNKTVNIPTIQSSPKSYQPVSPCGIHAIEINAGQTMLATGGSNANDVAVYSLPSLDPIYIGERSHKDYIFDLAWLDEQLLVSASRDSSIALWKINPDNLQEAGCSSHFSTKPQCDTAVLKLVVTGADKIRQVMFNQQRMEIVAMSLNASIYAIDVYTMTVKESKSLTVYQENVCLEQSADYNVYAIGSKNAISMVDPRKLQQSDKITSNLNNSGIRSMRFNRDLLTIGTGNGQIMFYDMRNQKFLFPDTALEKFSDPTHRARTSMLVSAEGHVDRDFNYYEAYHLFPYHPAIYTHCFDVSGTKIFAAGGPLPACITGNYAAIWS